MRLLALLTYLRISPLHLPTSPISPYISLHLTISPYLSLHLPTSPYISLHLAVSRLLALLTLGTREALRVGEAHAQWRRHGERRAGAGLEVQRVHGVAAAAALLRLGVGLGLGLGFGLGLGLRLGLGGRYHMAYGEAQGRDHL